MLPYIYKISSKFAVYCITSCQNDHLCCIRGSPLKTISDPSPYNLKFVSKKSPSISALENNPPAYPHNNPKQPCIKYITLLLETQRKCRPCCCSSISINSSSFCPFGRNSTLAISFLSKDDISDAERERKMRRDREREQSEE